MKTYYHNTGSDWCDGACLYVINRIDVPDCTLYVINHEEEKFALYDIVDGEPLSSQAWCHDSLPEDIGENVWRLSDGK